MLHTKLTKKPEIPNYASFHKLSYGIWVSISQIMPSPRSKMPCSTQPFFQLTTVHHEKVTPPPLCNDRTTPAAAIHSYPLPIYHRCTMGASTSLHISVGTTHIPLHQQPARTEFIDDVWFPPNYYTVSYSNGQQHQQPFAHRIYKH